MNFDPCEFVDREPELQDFQTLLDAGATKRVLLFHGPPGIGKTWLAQRLCVQCRDAGVQFALLDFEACEEYKRYKVSDIITGLQRQIGGDFSTRIGARLCALEREFASPNPLEQVFASSPQGGGPLQYASAGTISLTARDVGERAVVMTGQNLFNNVQFYMNPARESELLLEQKQLGLERIVQEELESLLAQRPVVLLFDSCDCAPRDVLDWLQRQFIEPLIQGALANHQRLSVIVTGAQEGKRGPWVGELAGRSWGVVADRLGNLLPADVRRWWVEIRGLSDQTLPAYASRLGSPPGLMFMNAQWAAQMEAGRGG